MQKIPFLIAALLLAPLIASAQVELVYQTPTEALVIKGMNDRIPVYEKAGRLMPIPDEGDFAIRPGGAYADLFAEAFVRYRVKDQLPSYTKPGGLTVSYNLALAQPENKIKALDVYYACLWQMPGKITQVVIKPLKAANDGRYDASGEFLLEPGGEKGFLRVYFFADGKQIMGIERMDANSAVEFAAFKVAVDGGDRAAVVAWASAYPEAKLSKSLLQSVVQWGDTEAVAAILGLPSTAKKLRGDLGTYLLGAAIMAGRSESVRLLLKNGVKAERQFESMYPIQLAADSGWLGVLQPIVEKGVDVNAHHGALLVAFRTGKVELVDYLTAHGAKWPKSKEELSFWAVQAMNDGSAATFDRALSRGADPNRLYMEKPLLVYTAVAGRNDMVKSLLAHGANVEGTDKWHTTALMAAAAAGNIGMVDDLVRAGASLSAKNVAGNTAAAYAIKGGHADMARDLVRRYQPDEDDWARLLTAAILAGDENSARWAVAHTGRIVYHASETEGLMCEAIRLNLGGIVRMLMQNGLNGNGVVLGDWNYAGLAERYERVEILRLFQEQLGAELTVKSPVVSKLPARQTDFVTVPVPPEVLERKLQGEARVEIYIEPGGRPVFPRLLSSTNPAIDAYATQSVMRSDYNRVPGREWRRVVIPVRFGAESLDTSDETVDRVSHLDVAPILLEPNAGVFAFLKDQPREARVALVDLTIDRAGTVDFAAVVAGQAVVTAEQVVSAAGPLKFSQGKKGGNPVSYVLRGAWLMPQARYVPVGTLVAVHELQAGDRLPKILKRDVSQIQAGLKRSGAQAVIVTYTVTSAGRARDIQVIATTSREAAARAVETCAETRYIPGRKAGAEAAVDVAECLTEAAWEDMFRVVN